MTRTQDDASDFGVVGRGGPAGPAGAAPGKRSMTQGLAPRPILFRVESAEAARELGVAFGRRDGNGVAESAEAAVERAASGGGEPLRADVRERFESSLGADLSAVRVHRSAASAEANVAVGAKAYTVGNDIHFGAGHYQPDDPFGMHLLAHEVAHTQQQAGGPQRRQYKLEVSAPADHAEVEADRAADAMVSGAGFALSGAASGVARKPAPTSSEPALDEGANEQGKAAATGIITQSLSEAKQIKKDRDEAKVLLGVVSSGRDQLDQELTAAKAKLAAATDEAATDAASAEVDDLTAKVAEVGTLETEFNETIEKANTDLALVTRPGVTPAELNDVLASRGVAKARSRTPVQIAVIDNLVMKQAGKGSKYKRLTSEDVTVAQAVQSFKGGSAVDTTTTTSKLDVSGASWGSKDETRVTTATASGTTSTETKSKVGLDGYTGTTEEKSEKKEGELETGSSRTTTTKIGPSELSHTTAEEETVDQTSVKTKTKFGATRGDGKLGINASKEKQIGEFEKDDDGNPVLVNGHKNSASGEAFIQADAETVGAGGSATAKRENAHSKNVRTGTFGACDGGVTVSVKPYEGDDDSLKDRFVIILSVKGSASVGGDAALGKTGGSGLSVEAKGKVSGGVTFKHVLSAAETQAYLDDLGAVTPGNAGNGKHPEFAKIAAAWRDGWSGDGAKAMQEASKAALDSSPEAAKAMQDGDEAGYEVAADGSVGVGANAKSGGVTVGVKAGWIKKGSLLYNVAKVKGNIVISIQIDSEQGWSAGGEVGYGVTGSAGFESTKGTGSGVVFFLNPDDPSYSAERSDIDSATSMADLERLKGQYPKRLKEQSISETATDKETYGLKISDDVGLEMGGTGKVGKKTIKDADGKEIEIHDGTSSGGSKVKAGPIELNNQHAEGITTKVTADNQATGDLFATDSDSDVTKSLLDWDDRKNQSGAAGDATGSTKFKMLDSVDQQGLMLTNDDYNRIIGRAGNKDAWLGYAQGDFDEWEALGAEIRAAKKDKKKVAAALARFMGDGDSTDRKDSLGSVVRDAHTNQGGTGYEFPEGMADLKASYAALVFNDPCVKARELLAAGDKKAAAVEAQQKSAALESLYNSLSSDNADKFLNKAAFAEMLARIGTRQKELAVYLGKSDANTAKDRYNQLLSSCQGYKRTEDQTYAKITEAMSGFADAVEQVRLENEVRDIYVEWDKAYKEMGQLVAEWGFDKEVLHRYKPDKYRLKQVQNNEKPTGKTLEMENEDRALDEQRERNDQSASDHLRESLSARPSEGSGKASEDPGAILYKRTMSTQRNRIAAAKRLAAEAASWHNHANKTGKKISEPAQAKAGAGWTHFAQAEAAHQEWEAKQGMSVDQIVKRVDAIEAMFLAARSSFDDGKDLQ